MLIWKDSILRNGRFAKGRDTGHTARGKSLFNTVNLCMTIHTLTACLHIYV